MSDFVQGLLWIVGLAGVLALLFWLCVRFRIFRHLFFGVLFGGLIGLLLSLLFKFCNWLIFWTIEGEGLFELGGAVAGVLVGLLVGAWTYRRSE